MELDWHLQDGLYESDECRAFNRKGNNRGILKPTSKFSLDVVKYTLHLLKESQALRGACCWLWGWAMLLFNGSIVLDLSSATFQKLRSGRKPVHWAISILYFSPWDIWEKTDKYSQLESRAWCLHHISLSLFISTSGFSVLGKLMTVHKCEGKKANEQIKPTGLC